MKYTKHAVIIAALLMYPTFFFSGINTFTFYIKPYPVTTPKEKSDQALLDDIHTPGKLNKIALRGICTKQSPSNSIFSTYCGYMTLPDCSGRVTYPRKHQKPTFTFIITSKIVPVMMVGNTVHHFELDPSVATDLYDLERKQDNETELYFWQMKKIDSLKNNALPLNSVVLFAKPKNMYVPVGITPTIKNPQFTLPDIYAKKNVNIVARSLWVLTKKHFFSQMPTTFKKQSNTYFSTQFAF